MGLLDKLLGKNKARPTLAQDIPKAAAWLTEAMAHSGYALDGSVESFRELDRFFDEQQCPGGLLDGRVGNKLFAIGCYMGQALIARLGGVWLTDDEDPMGEMNIAVRLPDGSTVWPVQRAMKRFENGAEEGLYIYGAVLSQRGPANQIGRAHV